MIASNQKLSLYLIATFALISALLCIFLPNLYLFDFSIYWKACTFFLANKNPYELPHYASYVSNWPDALRPSVDKANMIVTGSPFSFAILFPFGYLSLAEAKKLFTFLEFFGVLTAIYLNYLVFLKQTSSKLAKISCFLILPYGFWISGLVWGSPTWMMYFFLSVAVYLIDQKYFFLSGFFLSFLLLKIHLVVILFTALSIWAIKNKKTSPLIGLAVGLTVFLMIIIIVNPNVFHYYISILNDSRTFELKTSSLPSLVASYLNYPRNSVLLFSQVFFVLITLFVSKQYKSFSLEKTLALFAFLSVFLASGAWGHDYILAFPLIFLLFKDKENIYHRKWQISLIMILLSSLACLYLISINLYLSKHFYLLAASPLLVVFLIELFSYKETTFMRTD